MSDVASDRAALELLRAQRNRLADRMRPPWWYLAGVAILWALVFADPFGSRYLFRGIRAWPTMVAGLAVVCLLQWGLARATGIKMGFGNLRSPEPSAGRPAAIAIVVVGLAAAETEHFLIGDGLSWFAVVVAALAVVAEVVAQQALLRGIRQDLRAGDEAA